MRLLLQNGARRSAHVKRVRLTAGRRLHSLDIDCCSQSSECGSVQVGSRSVELAAKGATDSNVNIQRQPTFRCENKPDVLQRETPLQKNTGCTAQRMDPGLWNLWDKRSGYVQIQ
eukprot:582036-Pleurochrysis_carterae.AAC.2